MRDRASTELSSWSGTPQCRCFLSIASGNYAKASLRLLVSVTDFEK